MEKNLDHLTSEEIETLMQRYYAGESVSKLTKEYGISVRSSDLYKLFPPEVFPNYICEYCDEPLVINRPSNHEEPPKIWARLILSSLWAQAVSNSL